MSRFALSPGGDTAGVRHAVSWLGWWLALFWLWLLLAGEWNRQEWVAAAAAAAIGATLGELARARTGASPSLPRRALADAPRALGMVVVDFGIVAWALLESLARCEVVRGEFRSHELAPATRARDPRLRAWTALLASFSPNAYVVEIERESRSVLLHDLRPYRRSEEPA
jgi:hypothetical protein